jgi:peptidyl-prolyl cis-trans isomerase D
MLDLIRKKQKTLLVRVVFWVIIAAFVGTIFLVWGRGRDDGGIQTSVAAQVNDTEISYADYQRSYSNLYNLYQSIYQNNFTPELEKQLNLGQQAMEQLIQETLLIQEADRRGIKVSNQELVDSIAQYGAFQEGGKFSRDRYLQVLNYQRSTPEQFEAIQKRQLLTDKVRQQLQQGVAVDGTDIEQAYRDENDQISLAFARTAPALFESKVKVDDEKLQSFFNEQRENFRLPEKLSLRYLQFDPARYEKEISSFPQEDLERYYRRNLDLYEVKEQVKAAHILIRVPENADDAIRQQKKELAETLLKQVKDGKDFAELARTMSDDPGSASKGGDLGYFGRGMMVAPFEAAAFSLQPGEISNLVSTDFGYHIIKLEEYIAPGIKPLADAVEEVKAGLKIELARRLAYEKAMDAYNINRKTGSLEEAAKANDLGIKETGLFGRDDAIDGIGREEAISAAAFALAEGELARPIQTTQGIFLFTLKERRESRIPERTEVKAAVEQAYRSEQAKVLAEAAAEQLLATAKELGSLKQAAAKQQLEVDETDLIKRSFGAFIPKIGTSEELAESAFELTAEQPIADQVFTINDKYVVVSLKQSIPADPEKLDDAARNELRERLLQQKQEAAVNDKLKELRDQSRISLAPELADRFGSGRS